MYHKREISTLEGIQRQEMDEIIDRIHTVFKILKTKRKVRHSRLTCAMQTTEFAAPEGISRWHISYITPKHSSISGKSGILAAIHAKGTELLSFRTQTVMECHYGVL